jgi:SAM-dependent methyltransferase
MKTIQSSGKAWFETWFNSSFYHQLYANRDHKEAGDFIDCLLEELNPGQQAHIMDLGCGGGRHAKYLASRGYQVTGIDLSSASIRNAKKFEGDNLHFFRHDMRRPFGSNCFDNVFSFFTSFGYFKTNEENNAVIGNIEQSLKRGGTLMMDYLNPYVAEQNMVPSEEKEIDGIVYKITRWSDSSYIFKKICVDNMRSKEKFEFVEQVAKIYLHQFKILFARNGLRLKQVFGDYDLNGYDAEKSPRLILIAAKI